MRTQLGARAQLRSRNCTLMSHTLNKRALSVFSVLSKDGVVMFHSPVQCIQSCGERLPNKGGAKRGDVGVASPPRQRARGFMPKYKSWSIAFTKSKNVPSGKWDHGGFEKLYGSGRIREDGYTFAHLAPCKKVTLHVRNLAPTVTSTDLRELFEDYVIESAMVNYDEAGEPAGSADVVTGRASAESIVNNFKGMLLHGRMMRMLVIDENEDYEPRNFRTKERLRFQWVPRSRGINKRRESRFFKTGGGRILRSTGRGWKGGKVRKEADKRKRMTREELDRELDEYMRGGNVQV
uniref:RRM domain-containing protein n=1 Tax=Ascaris lumbricoides TaxID=6252 RepID=A0A0M3HSS4_ASCLU